MKQISQKKAARMSAEKKAKCLMADIIKSDDLHEIGELRQELNFYLDEIETNKVSKMLKKQYAATAAMAPTTLSW